MSIPAMMMILLIGVSILLIGGFVARPEAAATRGGKILAFVVLFFVPVLCAAVGGSYELERSKSTEFCLSCHVMKPFGRSLRIDDQSYLPAAHFQNHRVPADQACYTCHTDYALFGGVRAKLRGLRHLYVYYLRTPPAPEKITLYEPFNNRECLYCHLGARKFEEGAVHNADPSLLPDIKANKISCVSSGCHENVHNIAQHDKLKFWEGGR